MKQKNWEYIRNQAAIAAMQGLLSDNATINALMKDCFKDNMELENKVAMRAVAYADALIKEFQGKTMPNEEKA